jgi:hypothetical protein
LTIKTKSLRRNEGVGRAGDERKTGAGSVGLSHGWGFLFARASACRCLTDGDFRGMSHLILPAKNFMLYHQQ